MEEKTLIDKLNDINEYKNNIKSALGSKGFKKEDGEDIDMETVKFSEYADMIAQLQLPESGDTPTPTPTPSTDYIYSNGFLTNGTETNEIINFVPYEIVLDGDGKCEFELTCPDEISGYEPYENSLGMMDVIFTVDIPTAYNISKFEWLDESSTPPVYIDIDYKDNPRYSTIVRDGVTYKSYVRQVSDNVDYSSYDVQYAPLKYKITIEK